ncbi:cytochrome c [Pseudoxanthomonas sp.]|uniref:cytochrome c n=1 Tax=Pseudoxanthomonas sp. TaxID=1871049 RepID=UPI00262356F4|nr:cytochrome c [Pseudoxanthomonas sp.]WDS37310.1 MAG: cytochrome c [Pseudoxanthomonas sp.]
MRARGRARTRTLLGLGVLAVAVIVGTTFAITIARQSQLHMPTQQVGVDQATLVQRGAYVARVADCVACHTTDKDKPYAGGVAFDTPFGKLYSTNITQDRTDGIGSFTDEEIVGAIRNGISKDGRRLYPAMPYTSYTGMSDADVTALVAYLRTITPIQQAPPANTMGFPFNQRWAMAFWNVLNFHAGRQEKDPARSEAWNRGAYLVQTMEHCQECHTPRNFIQGLSGPTLSGGDLGPWNAYNITSSVNSGIGGWSDADIAGYLKTGEVHGKVNANAGGPMAEVVENSTSKLDDADIDAMVTYLRTVPAAENKDNAQPRFASGSAYTGIDHVRALGRSYDASSDAMDGQLLFNANCATCHTVTGKGVGEYPRLIGNTVLGDNDTRNVTAVILHGLHRKVGDHEVFMPGFTDLSDAQVATLGNFLFKQFGNARTTLTADDVRKAR